MAHTYQCGHPATPVGTLDGSGISNLAPGDTIRTGDFDVIVTEILSGGSGGWTGKGYTLIPYLGDTQIAVDFTSATVNECYEYTGGGTVQSAYDASWRSVADIDQTVDKIREFTTQLIDQISTYTGSQEQKSAIQSVSEKICLSTSTAITMLTESQVSSLTGLCQSFQTDVSTFLACPAPQDTTNARKGRISADACAVTSDQLIEEVKEIQTYFSSSSQSKTGIDVSGYLYRFKLLRTEENQIMTTKPRPEATSLSQISAKNIMLDGMLFDKITINFKGDPTSTYKILASGFVETSTGFILKDSESQQIIFEVVLDSKDIYIDQKRLVRYIHTNRASDNTNLFVMTPFALTGGDKAYWNRSNTEELGRYIPCANLFANGKGKNIDRKTNCGQMLLLENEHVFSNENDLVNQLLGDFIYRRGPENITFPENGKTATAFKKTSMFSKFIYQWSQTGKFEFILQGVPMGPLDELSLDLTGKFTTFEHFLGSFAVTPEKLAGGMVRFTIGNVTSIASGYLLKDFGFPSPISIPRSSSQLPLAFGNISQYFSLTMTTKEINDMILGYYLKNSCVECTSYDPRKPKLYKP